MTTPPTDLSPSPDRDAIRSGQLQNLRTLLGQLVSANPFYGPVLREASVGGDLPDVATFQQRVPFTTKADVVADQLAHPPYGSNLTLSLPHYTRISETSGTTGTPLRWLDTPETWQALLDNWQRVYAAAGVGPGQCILFAFSFGPFLGFWTAFEAALQLQCRCISGGGMSTEARLAAIQDHGVEVLCCTPTYALRLGQAARFAGAEQTVRQIIVAGEPGGSMPAVRSAIEQCWPGACVRDHHGMTEVGPVTYPCPACSDRMHVIESSYLPEVISVDGTVRAEGKGELVLTTLRRNACPLLRYRTGDLVHLVDNGPCVCGTCDVTLESGILGRIDDMVQVRGVNLYPSAVDEVVRRHTDVVEYRVEIRTVDGMAELAIEVEPLADGENAASLCRRVAEAMRDTFHLRVPVRAVEPEALPRFDMKASRWHRVS